MLERHVHHQGPATCNPPSTRMQVTLSLLLALCLVLPGMGIPPLPTASASGTTVGLWKTGNINYSDGAWNTHMFMANDGGGVTTAYCVEPAKNSPAEGDYAKSAIHSVSGRDFEMKVDLWFCYGGPGFDQSMWPSENWNGQPMSDEDYYLASHILLADTYSSNAWEATHGAGEAFRNWLVWNITGFSLENGELINANAMGRQAWARSGEVPANFEVYQIDGGSAQTIAASSAYKPRGTIKMNKRSRNPEVTDGNPLYSMEGIEYALYVSSACDEGSDSGRRLVLDKDGYAEVEDLYITGYYIREVESSVAGTGYAYDPTVYTCVVRAGQVSWVHDTSNGVGDFDQNDVSDMPITEDVKVLIQKHDLLTQSSTPSGDASLAGALFEVDYHMNLDGDVSGTPTRTWTFRTDANGKVDLQNGAANAFVSGDALYRDPDSGEALFPLGTYAIRETDAPAGYELPDDAGPWVITISPNGSGAHDVDSAGLTDEGLIVDEAPIRQDLSFIKRDLDTQRPMSGVPFLATRIDDGGASIERHVIVTDANGRFDSSSTHAPHSRRTNVNDAALKVHPDGTYEVDEAALDPDAGTWFGTAADGSWSNPHDELGAFPDSTKDHYVFEELPCSANEGKTLVRFEAYAHAARPTTVDLGTVGNVTPTLVTEARDGADSDKTVSRDADARVVDSISCSGLVAENAYTIRGSLVDAASGAVLMDASGNPATASTSFTARATLETHELEFAFDATSIEDGSRVVVCEELYEGTRLVATHDDLADGAQTVTVASPLITTTACDAADGDSTLVGDTDAGIRDSVTYAGLVPKAQYEIEGTVMDKATGEPLLTSTGMVTSSATFIPQTSTGSIDMLFSFDATELDTGCELVVFERLYRDGVEIACHEDLDDIGQTVSVFPPSLFTRAHDPQDGDNVVAGDIETRIVDTVSYQGLVPGREYTLEATLMDKESGRALLDPFDRPVTATHAFTPIESNGSTDVTFVFDASNVNVATSAVVFEELYRDGRHLATHADIEDASQTIVIEQPCIQTYASCDGSSQKIMRDKDVTLLDSVSYRNLKTDAQYELTGQVIDRKSGEALLDGTGRPVEQRLTFTPEAATGTVEVAFELDASMLDEGTELVVFETLRRDGVEIACHRDIGETRQTVTVAAPSIATQARSSNDTKEVVRDTQAHVIDTVSYAGLAPQREYVLEGTVMQRASGEPLVDVSGDPVTARVSFTPDKSDGSVEIPFAFDASSLADGTELVVFERLRRDGMEIAAHEDLEDEGQTVCIASPAIETRALDPEDGDQVISACEDARVIDVVSFEGLQPGAEYRFVGTLMDRDAQSPVLRAQETPMQASTTFTPDAPSGSIEVDFSFDATGLEGDRDIVIFEELYRDERLIATHADYENRAQTVTVAHPRIETSACDAGDGDKELAHGTRATVIDTVSYAGLVAGKTYELEGRLMIDNGTLEGMAACDALGTPITTRTSFVPEASHGSIDMSFEVDTSLLAEGTRIVAFESLYDDHVLVADHADIQDEQQTVTVGADEPPVMPPATPTPDVPASGLLSRTGDKAFWMFLACALVGSTAFATLALLRRKAFGTMDETKRR